MDIFIKNGVIKKREEVEQNIFKKNYDTDFDSNIPGPYYDLYNNHCHIWKSLALIKNFKGEQNQSEQKYRQHSGELPTKGLYCSICHFRLKSKGYDLKKIIEIPQQPYFKKRKIEEELSKMLQCVKITKKDSTILWDRLYFLLQKSYICKYRRVYEAVLEIKKQSYKIQNKWHSLCLKLMEPYVYYQLSGLESIKIKMSEMTPFQRFKYKNLNYKKNTSFIIYNNKFETNYVTIN